MAPMTPTLDPTANHDAEIISISVVFTTLSLLSVIARLTSRKMLHSTFGADDILLLCSWVHIFPEKILHELNRAY